MSYFIVPCEKFGSLYMGMSQQLQEQRYPFLPVCEVFTCVQTMVRLPVFGIFSVGTDVDACDCTRGLYGHHRRVHWKLTLGQKTFAVPGTRTRVSIAPGFSVERSTN